MSWTATTEDGLAELLGTLMGIPCAWRHRPQQVVADASAVIDVISEVAVGQAEVEHELVDDALEVTVHGLREVTLQVSVWSASQAGGQTARTYTSALRTRLALPSTVEALRALGLGVVSVGDAAQADVAQLGRHRSGSLLELRLCLGDTQSDIAVPFVETVRVHTNDGAPGLENAGGDLLPASMQIDINPAP